MQSMLDGVQFVQRMMEELKWDKIDAGALEIMMNSTYVLENPYDIDNGNTKTAFGKYKGIELLHKIMMKQKIKEFKDKDIKLVFYMVRNYDLLFPKK